MPRTCCRSRGCALCEVRWQGRSLSPGPGSLRPRPKCLCPPRLRPVTLIRHHYDASDGERRRSQAAARAAFELQEPACSPQGGCAPPRQQARGVPRCACCSLRSARRRFRSFARRRAHPEPPISALRCHRRSCCGRHDRDGAHRFPERHCQRPRGSPGGHRRRARFHRGAIFLWLLHHLAHLAGEGGDVPAHQEADGQHHADAGYRSPREGAAGESQASGTEWGRVRPWARARQPKPSAR